MGIPVRVLVRHRWGVREQHRHPIRGLKPVRRERDRLDRDRAVGAILQGDRVQLPGSVRRDDSVTRHDSVIEGDLRPWCPAHRCPYGDLNVAVRCRGTIGRGGDHRRDDAPRAGDPVRGNGDGCLQRQHRDGCVHQSGRRHRHGEKVGFTAGRSSRFLLLGNIAEGKRDRCDTYPEGGFRVVSVQRGDGVVGLSDLYGAALIGKLSTRGGGGGGGQFRGIQHCDGQATQARQNVEGTGPGTVDAAGADTLCTVGGAAVGNQLGGGGGVCGSGGKQPGIAQHFKPGQHRNPGGFDLALRRHGIQNARVINGPIRLVVHCRCPEPQYWAVTAATFFTTGMASADGAVVLFVSGVMSTPAMAAPMLFDVAVTGPPPWEQY